MALSEAGFIAIVEAAADLNDYSLGQYFSAKSTRPGLSTQKVKEPFAKTINNPLRLRDTKVLPRWAIELRQMLNALTEFEFSAKGSSSLNRLCECGSRYGLRTLEATIAPKLESYLSQKAKRRLTNDLQRMIVWATRPCFLLELDAFRRAMDAIRTSNEVHSAHMIEQNFLGERPADRLFRIFKTFPVLARLWSELTCQWRDRVTEFLLRFEADRDALSRTFFDGRPLDRIIDLRCNLSDAHNAGRAVMSLQFQSGSIIYKPRPGDGELEWRRLLYWMNTHSFQPKFKAASVLQRAGYCWMERVERASCRNKSAANRFYRRLGGMIAAAYLSRAVDFHRDNLIASGEYPILVDAETLWHAPRKRKKMNPVDALRQTGFLPSSNRRLSWQYRSSVLAKKAPPGQHTLRMNSKPLAAVQYEQRIIKGFGRAWRCILGTSGRRVSFARRARRIRATRRRRIYWPTVNYDAIRQASVQPAVLRSGTKRLRFIAAACRRTGVPPLVVDSETRALKMLDIPYFTHKSNAAWIDKDKDLPKELVQTIRETLRL